MVSQNNKTVFSHNLVRLMREHGKTRNDLCRELGLKYTTVTGWEIGDAIPHINKIEMLADYFGVAKSDLIEPPQHSDMTARLVKALDGLTEEDKQMLYAQILTIQRMRES